MYIKGRNILSKVSYQDSLLTLSSRGQGRGQVKTRADRKLTKVWIKGVFVKTCD